MREAKHGTRTRYVQGCRCDKCKRANAIYRAEFRAREKEGEIVDRRGTRPGRVDVAETLAAIVSARSVGVSLARIAKRSRVSETTLSKIVTGKSRRTTEAHARAIIRACTSLHESASIPAE